MDVDGLLIELYGRVRGHVHGIAEGLAAEDLVTPPEDGSNPIGWLLWHLTRVQDHHVSELLDEPQRYLTSGWAERFGLAADPDDIGYGHTAEQVAAVRPGDVADLVAYYDDVADRTDAFLATLAPTDLDRIVDERWDPPVSLGVRLVSIADDDIQHAGQAAYLKGLLARR